MWIFLILVAVFVPLGNKPTFVTGQKLQDEQDLLAKLLTGYNKHIRPRENLNDVTNISLKFYITTLKNYDEKNGQLSIAGAITLEWIDQRLAWDPSNASYIYSTHVSKTQVWRPPFVIVNAYNEFISLGTSDKLDDYLWLMHDGKVLWSTGAYFDVICPANVVYFPFDTQICHLQFLPWFYSHTELKFNISNSKFDKSYFYKNGLWELEDSSVYITKSTSGEDNIIFSLTMKRKPAFYVMNTLVPMCIIGTLNIFVFLLPSDTGERIGLCVTLLLAITVFMTIVSDALPNTATPSLAVNNYFLFFDINVNVIILLCVIIIARFYYADQDTDVTPFYRSMYKSLQKLKPKCLKRRVFSLTDDDLNLDKKINDEIKLTNGKPSDDRNKQETGDQSTNENMFGNACTKILWKDIGETMDKICMFFFSGIYVIRFCVYFAIMAPHI